MIFPGKKAVWHRLSFPPPPLGRSPGAGDHEHGAHGPTARAPPPCGNVAAAYVARDVGRCGPRGSSVGFSSSRGTKAGPGARSEAAACAGQVWGWWRIWG